MGDTDLDGFPDLLFVAATSDGHTPKLLVSEPCARGLPGCDGYGHGRRGFRLVQKGTESLEAIKDARGVTLLDLDEDVRAILVVLWFILITLDRERLTFSCRERERKGKGRFRSYIITFIMMLSSSRQSVRLLVLGGILLVKDRSPQWRM